MDVCVCNSHQRGDFLVTVVARTLVGGEHELANSKANVFPAVVLVVSSQSFTTAWLCV